MDEAGRERYRDKEEELGGGEAKDQADREGDIEDQEEGEGEEEGKGDRDWEDEADVQAETEAKEKGGLED